MPSTALGNHQSSQVEHSQLTGQLVITTSGLTPSPLFRGIGGASAAQLPEIP
jgi:hypothetical protein